MNSINPPLVTLILPIRNESACIELSLGATLIQDYPASRTEILIVDGMSDDDTRQKMRALIDSSHSARPSIRILDNPGKIVPIGLNLALQQAKGEIIIRVDGHTRIAPDYVRQCVEALQRTDADNVGGKMNAVGKDFFSNAVALATSVPFGIGGGRFHYSDKEEWVDTVYMGAWPRRVFEKIGLFDEELVRDQDDEFNYRLRAAGGKILLSPKIISEYTVRASSSALWRQYFQYGFWKVRVLQKHPGQMSLRQFVPPAFVLSLIASILFALTSFLHPSLIVLLLPAPYFLLLSLFIPLSYLLANLTASLWTVITKDHTVHNTPFSKVYTIFLLSVVFSILHLSYGLGFWAGLVKFWNRWADKTGRCGLSLLSSTKSQAVK
ncbi:MAG: glycosyltransferase [Anaerolineaceae bacterium]|jgi:glycosyltransferase involved in cell wall biosynthesis